MRVAVVSDMVRPNGAGVMALLGADILTDIGCEVVVLGGSVQPDLLQQLDTSHFAAEAFTNDEPALDGSFDETAHGSFKAALRTWFDGRLEHYQPDVLYIHNCGRILSQFDVADLSCRFPVVFTMHDEWLTTDAHYTFTSKLTGERVSTFEPNRCENVLDHRYDHIFEVPRRAGQLTIIGPSSWITERARQVFPSLDVRHLPNPVDTDLFGLQDRAEARRHLGINSDRPIVAFIGNPTQERKGFTAFESATRLVETADGRSPLRLIAGGSTSGALGAGEDDLVPGPILDLLHQPENLAIEGIRVDGDAILIRGLARSSMAAVYGAADVVVHPSIIDNLPTVPIEAGLCGTRCLASDVGGTSEVVAEVDSLFPLETDAQELAQRISDAIESARSETVADRQGRRDRQLARFAVSVHRDRLVPLFESIRGGTP